MSEAKEKLDAATRRASHCYSDDYRVFRIEDGETHWCVAMSEDEALKAHGVSELGYQTVAAYLEDLGPVQCEIVAASDEISVSDDNGGSETKSAKDWAVTHRGVFCSTYW